MKRPFLAFSALAAMAAFSAAVLLQAQSTAFTFNQNRIIDDLIFDNKSSMTAAAIDTFLNQFPASCISTNNHFLAIDPTGYSPTAGFSYGGNVTAGQVIYDAAQAYDINPQVLITTLQKEQSLVDGTAGCSVLRYTGAMGYGCPDGGTTHNYSGLNLYTLNGTTVTSVSGTCVNTSSKAGFTQQVIRGAWLLKFGEQRSEGSINWAIVRGNWDNSDDPQSCYSGPMTQGTWQRCPSGGSSFYDGYTTIDGTAVHMDNGATATLYWYTPHFHGNQSFFDIFTNWFGSTQAPDYSWQLTTQYAYTDATKTTIASMNTLAPGQRVYVGFTAKNTGNQTWTNSGPNAIMLGTAAPMERFSRFYDPSWLSATRPALMEEATVAPGETATFEFWITAPITPGSGGVYNERFNLLASGIRWFNDVGLSYYTNVQQPIYSWRMASQYAYTDTNKTTVVDINHVLPGQRMYIGFTAVNTGNMTWRNNGSNALMVGTAAPLERANSRFRDPSWLSTSRPVAMTEATVAPGQTGTFEFWVRAPVSPNTGGIYNERFNIVANNLTWFNDVGLSYYFNVQQPTYTWQLVSQYAYTDGSKTTPVNMNNVVAGQRIYIGFTAKNTGNVTWNNSGANAIMVGTAAPLERSSKFHDSSWLSISRPVLMTEATVAPGQTGTFEFWLTAPSGSGSVGIYNERFDLIANSLTWLSDIGLSYYVNVH